MDDLEIDQARAIGLLVIDDVRRRRVAVRPWAIEFVRPKLVGAAKLIRGRPQHPLIERALLHVVPNTFARQFVFDNRSLSRGDGVKTIAVEHLETHYLPAPPIVDFAP